MIDSLSLARFRELADAYGGGVARWPEHYRDAAMLIASEAAAIEILARASALDETLDAWHVPAPAAHLRASILADAPVPGRAFVLRTRLWWSGIGIAAALAGATAGAAAVAVFAPIETPTDVGTSFGDVAA